MHKFLALIALLAGQVQVPLERGTLIATNQEIGTEARVVESTDQVRFVITAPANIVPTIGIDVQRNGVVDRGVDFELGFDADKNNEPCLEVMFTKDRFSDCQNPGERARIVQVRRGAVVETSFILPKRQASADGIGVGFALSVFDKTGNFEVLLASGEYQFGGKLSLIKDGPNFMGRAPSNLPVAVELPLRRYRSCLFLGLKKLSPLSRAKVPLIEAVPTSCAATRSSSYAEAVEGLVSSGVTRGVAESDVSGLLNAADAEITGFATQLSASVQTPHQ